MDNLKVTSESFIMFSKKLRRFAVALPQMILLKRNFWVELSVLIISGGISIFLLFMFAFNSHTKGISTDDFVPQRQVALSTTAIEEIEDWIQEREEERQRGGRDLLRALNEIE